MQPAMDETTFLNTTQEFFPELRAMPQDLKNPTPEFACNFYNHVLRDLGIDLQALQMPQGTQIEKFSSQEAFQDIVPLLNTSKTIQYIFSEIGFGRLHFGVNDLLAPSPKRNLVLMTNFLNFLIFCDSQVAKFEPKIKAFNDFKVRHKDLAKMRDELKKQMNQQATGRVEGLRMKKELKAQKKAAEKKLNEMAEEFEECRVLQKQSKIQLKSEEQAFEKSNKQMRALEHELENLKSQIVSSPGEFQDQFDKLVEQKGEAEQKAEHLLEQIEPKKETNETLSSAIDSHEIRLSILNDVIDLNKIIRNLKAEIGALKKKKRSAKEGLENTQENLKILRKKLEQTQKSFDVLKAKWERDHCVLESSQKILKMKFDEVKSKFEEDSKRHKKLQQSIKDAISNLKDLENRFNEAVATGVTWKKIWTDVNNQKFDTLLAKMKEIEKLSKQL